MAVDRTIDSLSEGRGSGIQPLRVLRRRWYPATLAFLSALVVAFITALAWPPTYLSSGTILIEQQEVPTDLVRSTISSYAAQRIQVISQRVMTTANLLRIIQQYDLYPSQRKREGRETLVTRMRDHVRFHTISADVIDPRQGRPMQATIAFTLGFENGSAEIAARVANELASLFLQENLASRKQLAEEATKFLGDEAGKLSEQIQDLENKLATFKEQHIKDLPESAQINFQMLSRADEERRDIDTRLHALEQQLLYVDAQLTQISQSSQVFTSTGERVMSPADRLKTLRADYARASAVYADDHPDVARMRREIANLEATVGAASSDRERSAVLADAESKLSEARQRYSADHPDVLRLEKQVARLKADAENLASKAAAASGSSTTASKPQPTDQPDNPAYIQMKLQRESLNNDRLSLQMKRKQLDAKYADLEHRIESSPAVERDYLSLRRSLDEKQLKYREVHQKEMEAQLAQSLETERKGERFSLIEPPLVPEVPASPNRPLIFILGLVLAVVLGLATPLALEFADGSVRGLADMTLLLTAPPLAVIPHFQSGISPDVSRRKRLLRWIGGVVLVVFALGMVHVFVRPLDALWAAVLRKLGL